MGNEQELRPGALLRNGSYKIERVLGQSGFGITYLATDLSLERKVAIKEFFPKDYCEREGSTSHITLGTQSACGFVERLKAKFLKEARNIAKFDHPGIIKIYAAFEENNTAYYVMDYIEGESLSEMVKRNGPLAPKHAIRYLEKIGEALEYVHARKINHLDIKPANIMVRRCDDTPILIDFGLSKQYDQSGNQTSTTPTGISHGYAPMEQYSDGGVQEFSPQTDLYSLAATLYYTLSGIVPPQASALIEEPLTFPATIPATLRAPIEKAMSPMRRMRHETVKAFIDEISSKRHPANAQTSAPLYDDATEINTRPEATSLSFVESAPGEAPAPNSGSKKMWIIVIILAAMVCALIVALFVMGNKGDENNYDAELEETEETVEATETPENVVAVEEKEAVPEKKYDDNAPFQGQPLTQFMLVDRETANGVALRNPKTVASLLRNIGFKVSKTVEEMEPAQFTLTASRSTVYGGTTHLQYSGNDYMPQGRCVITFGNDREFREFKKTLDGTGWSRRGGDYYLGNVAAYLNGNTVTLVDE